MDTIDFKGKIENANAIAHWEWAPNKTKDIFPTCRPSRLYAENIIFALFFAFTIPLVS